MNRTNNILQTTIGGKPYACSAVSLLWMLAAAVAALLQINKGGTAINNYLIFEGVFEHTMQQKNLYLEYPSAYFDSNHYGPVFSWVIAPFAILPTKVGCFLWCMANAALLLFAFKKLPLHAAQQNVALLICLFEMIGATQNCQSNPMLAASIILAATYTQERKPFWATFFIALGFLVKLYGIVGLAFFFFSKDKIAFAGYFIFWLIVLFCLPMLLSSPSFIVQSYADWYASLTQKNSINAASDMQNMSAMRLVNGMLPTPISNGVFLVAAAIMALLPLLKIKYWMHTTYQLLYVSLLLIAVVIFSSSAEGATYIIAISGAAIWFVVQKSPKAYWQWILLCCVIILGSLSTSEVFPKWIRDEWIRPYGIKALPYFLLWVVLSVQLLFFSTTLFKNRVCVKK